MGDRQKKLTQRNEEKGTQLELLGSVVVSG